MDRDLPRCIISDGRIVSTALLIEFQFCTPLLLGVWTKQLANSCCFLSLSKILADLLTELECATDRSALIKASEHECRVLTSISVIKHAHLHLPWSILAGNTSSYPAPLTVDNPTGLLLLGTVMLLYPSSCMLLALLKLILSWIRLLLHRFFFFFFFAATRQTRGPQKSVKQLSKLVWPKGAHCSLSNCS